MTSDRLGPPIAWLSLVSLATPAAAVTPAAAAAPASVVAQAPEPDAAIGAPRPNVIVLMTDDQGYGDLGCHGNPVVRTPNLDRLHAESVRFTDFHVAPMCTPTRGQLMTGVDALRNGAMNVSSGRALLRREFPTLAEVMRDGGYATGIFGKWHLGDNFPFRPQDRGFDETLWFPSSFINAVPNHWDNDYFDDTYFHNGVPRVYEGYTTDVFFEAAMRWIERQAQEQEQEQAQARAREQSRERKPFFCYLPTAAPHGPLFVPARYRKAVAERLGDAMPELELPLRQRESLIRFLAMIENIDENVGRLEDLLRRLGLRDDTIFVFLTDNGSTMGPRYYNAGMKGRKTTLWEGGHRVPLFVRWPAGGLGAPRDVRDLTQVHDLLPTLVELCGLSVPRSARIDGASLVPLLRSRGAGTGGGSGAGQRARFPDRKLVVHYSRMPIGVTERRPDGPSVPTRDGAAVLWKRWRLLEDKALYDLEKDPLQEHDVIDEHPDVAAAMRRHLHEWWDGVAPRLREPVRVVVGSDAENPSKLTACEWFDVFVDQQRQVRTADRKFGAWHLEVARAGTYEIELRRWPREAGFAIGQGIPATPVTDGRFVAGRPIPVAAARLSVGEVDETVDLDDGAVAATFRVALEPGPATLQTWFLDAEGRGITGAYYAYVRRL